MLTEMAREHLTAVRTSNTPAPLHRRIGRPAWTWLGLLLLSWTAAQAGEPLTITDFDVPIAPLTAEDLDGTFPVRAPGTVLDDAALGGETDYVVVLNDAGTPGAKASFDVLDGVGIFSLEGGATGQLLVIDDGADDDAIHTQVSQRPGGPVDLTDDGALDGIEIQVASNDAPLKIGTVLFSGLEQASEAVLDLPVLDSPQAYHLPFADFEATRGDGADPSSITAVIVLVGALDSAVGPLQVQIDGIAAASSQPSGGEEPPSDDNGGEQPPSGSGVLLDQIDQLPSSAIWSLNFPGDNPWDAQAADDFEVPPGQTWTFSGAEWAVEWFPAPPPDPTANITIFADNAGAPGNPLFSESDRPIQPSDEVPGTWWVQVLEPPQFDPGKYWFLLEANCPIGTEMLIKESAAPRGDPYLWRNPGGAFGTSCSDWTPALQCLGSQPSVAIRLLGDVTEVGTPVGPIVSEPVYTPPTPRAGETFTVRISMENPHPVDVAALNVAWFANTVGEPDPEQPGDLFAEVVLDPGESFTFEDVFIMGEPGCYDSFVRVQDDLAPNDPPQISGPLTFCISDPEPQARALQVQETDERLILTDGREVKILTKTGEQVTVLTTSQPPIVRTLGDRIIIVDGRTVRILDPDGTERRGPITTANPPTVLTSGDRIVVVDGRSISVYDKDGNRITGPIATGNPPTVTTTETRIIVVDGSEVRLFDKDGNQIGDAIGATQPPTVLADGDRIVIVDGNRVRIFDADGNQLGGSIDTSTRPDVHVDDDRIIVVDGRQIRIYDRDGQQKGPAIGTSNRPSIRTSGRRIIVVDGSEVRLFDKDGNQIGSAISAMHPPAVRVVGDRILIIDGSGIRLFDEDGNQVGEPITTADQPRIRTFGDRFLVIEDQQTNIYDKDGNRFDPPIITSNPPIIRTTDDRIIVIDGDEMNIYDADGNRLSGPIIRSERTAGLMGSDVTFEPGEVEKLVWVPLAAPANVLMESDQALSAEAYGPGRELVDWTGAVVGTTTELRSEEPSEFFVVSLSRPEALRNTPQDVEVAIQFDDPLDAFIEDTPYRDHVIFSPFRTFPGGTDVFELPDGRSGPLFDLFVEEEYGYSPAFGIPGLGWLVDEEMPYVLYPPAGHPAALPPQGANHKDNYCGISTFIHSMESTFPGALKANVTTNATSWDEVGDNLDHSNWFGTRGGKMVSNVNANYGGATPATQNGKQYCAAQLTDTSPANLAAWAEDCDLKVLIYDLASAFGHWADVTAVTPNPADATKATLNFQDYGANYNVAYTRSTAVGTQIDFSAAPLNNTMRGNFDASDPVAGDGPTVVIVSAGSITVVPTESVYFYVVCECDPATGGMPTTTQSGKTLNP